MILQHLRIFFSLLVLIISFSFVSISKAATLLQPDDKSIRQPVNLTAPANSKQDNPDEFYVFERMWPNLPQPWYFSGPNDVAVDNDGYVYVADSGVDRIQKFDSDGNFITKWGSKGSDDGEFIFPSGIAVDNDMNVYVADRGNNRIQKFDLDGNFIVKWSTGSR